MNKPKNKPTRNKIILCICCACVLFAVIWLLAGLEMAASVLMILGAAAFLGTFAYQLSVLTISSFVSDLRIFRKGSRYEGTCTGTRHYYRSEHLVVEWSEDGVQHSGDFHAFRKLRRFPYPVNVYVLEEKANLGLYSLLLDVWFLLLCLPAAVMFVVWLCELVIELF